MYNGDSIWLTTSDDGVHWKDYDAAESSVVFPPGQTAANPIVKVAGGGDSLLRHEPLKTRRSHTSQPV